MHENTICQAMGNWHRTAAGRAWAKQLSAVRNGSFTVWLGCITAGSVSNIRSTDRVHREVGKASPGCAWQAGGVRAVELPSRQTRVQFGVSSWGMSVDSGDRDTFSMATSRPLAIASHQSAGSGGWQSVGDACF